MLSGFLQPALLIVIGVSFAYAARIAHRLRENGEKLHALLRHFQIRKAALDVPFDRFKELARAPRFKVGALKAHGEQPCAGSEEAKAMVEGLLAKLSP